MDTSPIEKALSTLQSELAEAEANAAQATARVDAIHKAIAGLREVILTAPSGRLFEPPTPAISIAREPATSVLKVKGRQTPRGRTAMATIYKEARKALTAEEVVVALNDRGWMTDLTRPIETVITTSKRLEDDGILEEVPGGRGKTRKFRYRLDKLPPLPEGSSNGHAGGDSG